MLVATMTICSGKWFFISFFLSVPRIFGDHCRFLIKNVSEIDREPDSTFLLHD